MEPTRQAVATPVYECEVHDEDLASVVDAVKYSAGFLCPTRISNWGC